MSMFLVLLMLPGGDYDELKAFPGAEGYGAVSVGGRGGEVRIVTNLNASGTGSLSNAVSQPGPATIVFEVGGVIRSNIRIGGNKITIAGQTAPSPGITIEGMVYVRNEVTTNLVLRYLRVRSPPPNRSSISAGSLDSIQLWKSRIAIIDHCSVSWATDEGIQVKDETTVQWCTIEPGATSGHPDGGPHNHGLLAYDVVEGITVHHCLFSGHDYRCPSIAPANNEAWRGDVRNNVMYNNRYCLVSDRQPGPINLIGNYFRDGPSARQVEVSPWSSGRYFFDGNYVDGIGYFDDFRGTNLPSAGLLNWPVDDAQIAYLKVIENAGCFPRDRVTKQVIDDLEDNTGVWGRRAPDAPSNSWYLLGLASETAPVDSDRDGMPDAWEVINNLNPNQKDNNKVIKTSGYTALEVYLHERANELLGVVSIPTPEPTPDPTPDPTPEPTPDPTPDPTPEPTPDPTPWWNRWVSRWGGWF